MSVGVLEQVRSRRTALILGYLVAAVAALAALVLATGGFVDTAMLGWYRGAFGTGFNLVQTLAYATPLVLIGLGVAPALRAGVITVGAEGQLVMGAIAAAWIALNLDGLPPILALPLGAVGGAAAGLGWALVAGFARVRWGVNEILFTLLANYLAGYLLAYLLRTSLRDPASTGTPKSPVLPDAALLPILPLPGRLHVGALLVVGLVVLAWYWQRTRSSFLVDLHGARPELAARLGLSSGRAVLTTFAVSGAAAGLAGWMQLAGVDGRLQPAVSAGVGFAGIAVAVLGGYRPLGIVLAAIAYASLTTGGNGIQIATGTVPASIGTVGQGVLLLTAALVVGVRQVLPAVATRRERAVQEVR
ncbi:ABC transporter permease [Nocardioides sp. Bht2]|uniref:ABC transporter permease n=1 Tax=Nocardioides sp. Bht2 TaxID=3392297 RepID=UPI0039B3B48E